MDFSELLQRANSNKISAKKNYDKKQRTKQDERQRLERTGVELRRKAASHLKNVQERAHKEREKYKGVPSSLPESPPSPAAQPTDRTHPHQPCPSRNTSKKEDKMAVCLSSNSKASSSCMSANTNHILAKSKSPLSNCVSSKPAHRASSSKGNATASVAASGSKGNATASVAASGSKGNATASVAASGSKGNATASVAASGSKGNATASVVGGAGKSKDGKLLTAQSVGAKNKRTLSHSASSLPDHRDGTPDKVVSKTKLSTNFHDLMKMAQQNSNREPAIVKASQDVRTVGSPSSACLPKGSSPVGKSLVDRVHLKDRSHRMPDSQHSKSLPNSLRQSPEIRVSSDPNSSLTQSPELRASSDKPAPARGCKAVKPPVSGTPTGNGQLLPTRSDLKKGGGVASPGMHVACLPGRSINKEVSGRRRVPLKGCVQRSGGGRPACANTFYGAATSRILGKDGQRHAFSAAGLGSYRSSWVDEMSEFMQSNELAPGEYSSDEDDLDGFLASDEEMEGEADYSSEIRKIFGYDRTKFRDDDDCAMESSYAQQEFEETRSAHIGRVEDEQELIREKADQAKRKRRMVNGKPALKQTKLH